MSRHALQRPRYACQHPRLISACFVTSLVDLSILLQGPRSPTLKRNPSTCCLISCEAKGVVGGFLFDVEFLGPCKSMSRSANDVA